MRLLQSISLFAAATTALTSAGWRSQSIYQIITDRFANDQGTTTASCNYGNYCGGTFRGIINKLPYIQGMGFTAIWISPIVKNIPGPTPYGWPYHGYWAQDLYSINSAFGTPDDLRALSKALHDRGMYLMVDVAPNHLAANSAPSAVDYTKLNPFNDFSYYHPYCPIDYTNKTSVQQCWAGDTVVSLPDLRTENVAVQRGLNTWISQLVSNYTIDGLRLDSAMAINAEFWPPFISSAKVYAMGEVLDGNPTTFGSWQKYMPGMLNYPAYYWLIRAFRSNSATLTELKNNIGWLGTTVSDSSLLGNFLENHDQPRFASYTKDVGLTRNAIAFTIFHEGIPVVYYGQEQGFSGAQDPHNREPLWTSLYAKTGMYDFIEKLNAARNVAISKDAGYVKSKSTILYSDEKVIVMSRGGVATSSPLIAVITNYGSGGSASITVTTGVPKSVTFTDLLTCDVFTSTSAGKMGITVVNGQPRALYRSDALMGNNSCAQIVSTSSAARSTNTASSTSSTSATTTTTTSSISTTSTSTSAIATATPLTCPASNNTIHTSPSNPSRSFLIECGIDHAGGDLSMLYVTSLTACLAKCSQTPLCTNFALSENACYLKSSLGRSIYNGVQGGRLLPCTPVTNLFLTFNVNVTTVWGESVVLLGSDERIGAWNVSNAVRMGSQRYMAGNPVWNVTVEGLVPGMSLEYKFLKVDGGKGTVGYEGGGNRKFMVPMGECESELVVEGSWQV